MIVACGYITIKKTNNNKKNNHSGRQWNPISSVERLSKNDCNEMPETVPLVIS